jgi:methyl-accepting chemotaxis protein
MPMTNPGKRLFMGKGKGYLVASGSQFRFIIFLIFLLIGYTILLRVFQKLAEIVQLPVFLPISLMTLLVFIGIAGILYSHTFVGPFVRIRKALDRLAEGDTTVNLRLRDSDDPMLKELVASISCLCENSHASHALIQETAQELFSEIAALQNSIRRGADNAEIQKHLDNLRKKQELAEKAIKKSGKA